MRLRLDVPITIVEINGNISLARVRLEENDGGILLTCSNLSSDKVEVVKEPREGCVILPGLGLDGFIWLTKK